MLYDIEEPRFMYPPRYAGNGKTGPSVRRRTARGFVRTRGTKKIRGVRGNKYVSDTTGRYMYEKMVGAGFLGDLWKKGKNIVTKFVNPKKLIRDIISPIVKEGKHLVTKPGEFAKQTARDIFNEAKNTLTDPRKLIGALKDPKGTLEKLVAKPISNIKDEYAKEVANRINNIVNQVKPIIQPVARPIYETMKKVDNATGGILGKTARTLHDKALNEGLAVLDTLSPIPIGLQDVARKVVKRVESNAADIVNKSQKKAKEIIQSGIQNAEKIVQKIPGEAGKKLGMRAIQQAQVMAGDVIHKINDQLGQPINTSMLTSLASIAGQGKKQRRKVHRTRTKRM